MQIAKEFYIPTVIRRRGAKPKPQAQCLNPDWAYYPACDTDVQRTWRRFGWTPTKNG